MTSNYLCVGGPLDGQYHSLPDYTISFKTLDGTFEYCLVWSREHRRFIWLLNTEHLEA